LSTGTSVMCSDIPVIDSPLLM